LEANPGLLKSFKIPSLVMKDLCNEIKFKEQRKGDLQKKKNNMRIREILDRNAAKDEVVTACIWQL
jgi:hypothetical protein